MHRLLVAISLLTVFWLAAVPGRTLAADTAAPQDFDRNACYAHCPCKSGIADHACAVCKQRCDAEYWMHLNQKSKKKGN
jgi:hypothetical protein